MYRIEANEASEEFYRCWQTAALHLQSQMHDCRLNWLKANLNPPLLEHLSFRLGNRLFFIRIDDVDGKIKGPGNPNGFRTIAAGCNGIACRMPMEFNGQSWVTTVSGWGLLDDQSGEVIDPITLITDEKIEMTNWEIQDCAVQVVRDYIQQKYECENITTQGHPKMDPSIWFDKGDGPEWVIVRGVKYPENQAQQPANLNEIISSCKTQSIKGYFASVALASSNEEFKVGIPVTPLWRGYGMCVKFDGLVSISTV